MFFFSIFSYWLRQVGVHALSVNGLPRRTNNCVESFHNSLRIKFNVVHPNLWKFLGKYIFYDSIIINRV